MEYASFFRSELVEEGIVSISGDLLRIFVVERLGDAMNSISVPLRYTPRKMLVDTENSQMIIIESDHNAISVDELSKLKSEDDSAPAPPAVPAASIKQEYNTDAIIEDVDMEADDDLPAAPAAQPMSVDQAASEEQILQEKLEAFIGPLKGGPGNWASCIRIVTPSLGQTSFILELKDNEAALWLFYIIIYF